MIKSPLRLIMFSECIEGERVYIITHDNWTIEGDNVVTGRHRYRIVVEGAQRS